MAAGNYLAGSTTSTEKQFYLMNKVGGKHWQPKKDLDTWNRSRAMRIRRTVIAQVPSIF